MKYFLFGLLAVGVATLGSVAEAKVGPSGLTTTWSVDALSESVPHGEEVVNGAFVSTLIEDAESGADVDEESTEFVSIDRRAEDRGLGRGLRDNVAAPPAANATDVELDARDLQTYHDSHRRVVEAVKAGAKPGETEAQFRARIAGLSLPATRVAGRIVADILRQTGNFGGTRALVSTSPTEVRIILVEVANGETKVRAVITMKLVVKDGKVVGFTGTIDK